MLLLSHKPNNIRKISPFITVRNDTKQYMKNIINEAVKPQQHTVKYEEAAISFKITERTREMLDYIQNQTQINRSDIIRLSISKFYNELKREEGA